MPFGSADALREEPHLMPPARDPSQPSTTRKGAASTRAAKPAKPAVKKPAPTAKQPAPETKPAEPAVVRLEIYATQTPPRTRKPATRKKAAGAVRRVATSLSRLAEDLEAKTGPKVP